MVAESIFYTSLDQLCLEFSEQVPGAMFRFTGKLQIKHQGFRERLRIERAKVFEQLTLFDTINFKVVGPNVVAPLLGQMMGANTFEVLLEQGAIAFTAWDQLNYALQTPQGPILWGGYTNDHPLGPNIEKLIDQGFDRYPAVYPPHLVKSLKRKLRDAHCILPRSLSSEASNVTTQALKAGHLEHYGFTEEEQRSGQMSAEKGRVFLQCADDLLEYRHLVEAQLTSFSEFKFFFPFRSSVKKLASCHAALAAFNEIAGAQEIPNLQSVFFELRNPFETLLKLRRRRASPKFRDWIKGTGDNAENRKAIAAYINDIKKKESFLEKGFAPYLKTAAFTGLSLAGAHALGDHFMDAFIADMSLEVLDRFLLSPLSKGFSPQMFFDDLIRLRRAGMIENGETEDRLS